MGNMIDWHLQVFRNGQLLDRPASFSSAEAAIEAGNELLLSADADEVTLYHRLYSNQASLNYQKPVPAEEIRQKAAHLEKQAQRAAKDG